MKHRVALIASGVALAFSAAAFAQGSGAGGTTSPGGDPTRPGVDRGTTQPGTSRDAPREPATSTPRVPSDSTTTFRPSNDTERAHCGQLSGTAQESCVRDLRARPGGTTGSPRSSAK